MADMDVDTPAPAQTVAAAPKGKSKADALKDGKKRFEVKKVRALSARHSAVYSLLTILLLFRNVVCVLCSGML